MFCHISSVLYTSNSFCNKENVLDYIFFNMFVIAVRRTFPGKKATSNEIIFCIALIDFDLSHASCLSFTLASAHLPESPHHEVEAV